MVGVAIGAPAVLAVLLAIVSPAHADTSDPSGPDTSSSAAASTPTPPPHAPDSGPPRAVSSPTPTDPAEIADPTISTPSAASLVSARLTVSGTRAPTDEVQLTIDGSDSAPLCTVAPDGTSTWSCPHVALPQGPDVTIRVSTTTDESRSSALTLAVLAPPAIDGAIGGGIVSSGIVQGTGYPGAHVTARLNNGAQCTGTADAHGAWSCFFPRGFADGRYRVGARQVAPAPFPDRPSDVSGERPFTLDTVAPPPPAITAPAQDARLPGNRSAIYRGTGVTGSTVTVWAGTPHSSTRVCLALVSNGSWQCTGAPLKDGDYIVSAVQADTAQNTSAASPSVRVSYESSTPDPGDGRDDGDQAAPPTSHCPTDGQSTDPGSGTAPHAIPAPSAPRQTPAEPTQRPPVATPFTAAVPSVFVEANSRGWVTAALLALAALLLFAVPARMLAGTMVAARGGAHSLRLFGRNRPRHDADESTMPTTTAWLPTAFGFALTTVVVTLAMPAAPDAAAARLLPAVLLAVIAVNGAPVVASRLATRNAVDVTVEWRFGPALLLVVAAASVASRLLGLEPALMFGVVAAVAVRGGTARARGIVAASGPVALAVLAAVGWLVIGILPAPTTVPAAFVAELLNTLVMLAIGSAAILLVPIGNGPGRTLFLWSTGRWVVLTLVVDTLLFAILAPTTRLEALGNVLLLVGLIAFAAISVALWVWRRFVAPALR